MPNFSNLILYAIPFFVLVMLLQLYITTKQHIKTHESKDGFSSIKIPEGINVELHQLTIVSKMGVVNKVLLISK